MNLMLQFNSQIANVTFQLTETLFIPANWEVDFRNCVFEFAIPVDAVDVGQIERDLTLRRMIHEIMDEKEEE